MQLGGVAETEWPVGITSVVSGAAAECLARLSIEDSKSYPKIKEALLSRYRISAETLRREFRTMRKKGDESFSDFAYRLKDAFKSWIEISKVKELKELKELLLVEQFLQFLPDNTKVHVLDR